MRDRQIGRESRIEGPAAELFEPSADHRHAGGAAGDQHHVDVRPAELVVLEQLERDFFGAVDQRLGEPLKLLQLDLVGLAVAAVVDGQGGAGTDRKPALGLLDFECQRLQAFRVLPRIVAKSLW